MFLGISQVTLEDKGNMGKRKRVLTREEETEIPSNFQMLVVKHQKSEKVDQWKSDA